MAAAWDKRRQTAKFDLAKTIWADPRSRRRHLTEFSKESQGASPVASRKRGLLRFE